MDDEDYNRQLSLLLLYRFSVELIYLSLFLAISFTLSFYTYVFKVIDRIAILVDIRLSLYYKVFDIILGYQEVVPLFYTVGKGYLGVRVLHDSYSVNLYILLGKVVCRVTLTLDILRFEYLTKLVEVNRSGYILTYI